MQHFTRTLFALVLSLGAFTAAFAGDGTKKAPYTPYELAAASENLAASKAAVYVKGDFLGFGANPAQPQEQPEDALNIIRVEETEGVYKYVGEEVTGAYSLTIGANQLAAFGLDCNFRVENAGKMAYATASVDDNTEGDFYYHV